MLEILYANKLKILEKSQLFVTNNLLKNSNSQSLKIGCELEFFLLDSNKNRISDNDIIDKFCQLINAKREQGASQIEVVTNFTADLISLAFEIDNLKNDINYLANSMNLIACFDGKPFLEDCGSSLQFNISLHNGDDYNLFTFENNLHEYCASGLLDLTNSMLLLLVPNSQDYQRFDIDLNKKLFANKKYTSPVNLSLGNDNRSCAVRFCNSSFNKTKRLEYRIASANCDIFLALSVVILALTSGIVEKKASYKTTYGNAFDDIYSIEKILPNIVKARNIFLQKDNFFLKKMLEFIYD